MMLTKTRSILHLTQRHEDRVYFAHDEEPHTALASMTEAAWLEMGSPDVVTVTIEPGDHLN